MFDIKKISSVLLVDPFELQEIDSKVSEFLYNETTSYSLFKSWHAFFLTNNFDLGLIQKFFNSYWKWYVIVTWYNFSAHNEEILSQVVPVQFMMACKMEFNVPRLYANHIVSSIPDEKIQDELHASISRQVLNSSLPFDYHSGRDLVTLVKELKKIDSLGSIERSQLYGQVEDFLFEDGFDFYTTEQKLKKIEDIFEYIRFLSDPKSIIEFRTLYVKTAPHLTKNLIDSFLTGETLLEDREQIGEIFGSKTSEVRVPSLNKFQVIRKQILAESKNTTEDFEDFVLGKLQEFSVEQNDPRILDLYYYDEQAEKFVWNDELIGGE